MREKGLNSWAQIGLRGVFMAYENSEGPKGLYVTFVLSGL